MNPDTLHRAHTANPFQPQLDTSFAKRSSYVRRSSSWAKSKDLHSSQYS